MVQFGVIGAQCADCVFERVDASADMEGKVVCGSVSSGDVNSEVRVTLGVLAAEVRIRFEITEGVVGQEAKSVDNSLGDAIGGQSHWVDLGRLTEGFYDTASYRS